MSAADDFQAKYPKLFVLRGTEKSCMNGDLSIGKGWFHLLDEACQKLESYRDRCPDIHLLQVKEKFARLTIYVGFSEKDPELCREIYDSIEDVCNKSLHVCENCGSKNDVNIFSNDGFWIKSLCSHCRNPSVKLSEQMKYVVETFTEQYEIIKNKILSRVKRKEQ